MSPAPRPTWDFGTPSKTTDRSPWLAVEAREENLKSASRAAKGLDEELEEIRRGFRRFRHTAAS
jgi:hypothetical protein